jgi:hypothetical protein
VLTLGAGGVLAEILQDTVSLLVPASRRRSARAGSPADRAASRWLSRRAAGRSRRTSRAIDAVQDCVPAHAGELLELEINPLIVTPDRAVAADALITMGEG